MSKNRTEMQNPFIVGTHLYLRPLEPAQDYHQVALWHNSEETRSYFNVYPSSDARSKDQLDQLYRNFRQILFGIALKDSNTLIGAVALKDINTLNQTADFTIKMDPFVQGKGYDTEATRLMARYGFMELNLNRIQAQDLEENVEGRQAYERAGFQFEVTLREFILRAGKYHNVRVYGLLREDFLRQNRA